MNDKITRVKLNAMRLGKKVRGIMSRHFNITFSLKRKSDPENPTLSVNVKGEIPREVVAFFAALGAITLLCGIWKILRKLF